MMKLVLGMVCGAILLFFTASCGSGRSENATSESPTLLRGTTPLPEVFNRVAEEGFNVVVNRDQIDDEILGQAGLDLEKNWYVLSTSLKKLAACRRYFHPKVTIAFSKEMGFRVSSFPSAEVFINVLGGSITEQLLRLTQIVEFWFYKYKYRRVSPIRIYPCEKTCDSHSFLTADKTNFYLLLEGYPSLLAFQEKFSSRISEIRIHRRNLYDAEKKFLELDASSPDFQGIMRRIAAKDLRTVAKLVDEESRP